MTISAAELKRNVEKVIDDVPDSGQPTEVERNGKRVENRPIAERPKLRRLVRRPDFILGDPEDLVHVDWSGELNVDSP